MYGGYLTILNTNKTESLRTVFSRQDFNFLAIMEIKCEWRLVGSPEWQSVEDFRVESTLPFTCEPLQPEPIYWSANVPST